VGDAGFYVGVAEEGGAVVDRRPTDATHEGIVAGLVDALTNITKTSHVSSPANRRESTRDGIVF